MFLTRIRYIIYNQPFDPAFDTNFDLRSSAE